MLTLLEFEKHYWYKRELERLCHEFKLESGGTKAELEKRLRYFLKTGRHLNDERKQYKNIRLHTTKRASLNLQTKIIPAGVKFNTNLRMFLANYFHQKNFKFTKYMAAAVREAERRADKNFSIADLIQVYKQGKTSRLGSAEEKTGQWNRFVKMFNKDIQTKQFKNKMRAAAFLWNKVRDSAEPKIYQSKLLKKFKTELANL